MCKVSLAVTIKIIIFLPSHKYNNVGERWSRGRGEPRDTSRDLRTAVMVKDVGVGSTWGELCQGWGGCLPVGTGEIKAPGNLGQSQSSNLPTLTSRPLQHQTVRPRTILPGCQRSKEQERKKYRSCGKNSWDMRVFLESLSCITLMWHPLNYYWIWNKCKGLNSLSCIWTTAHHGI